MMSDLQNYVLFSSVPFLPILLFFFSFSMEL